MKNKDVIAGSIVFMASVILAAITELYLVVPMAVGYMCYALIAMNRGLSAREIKDMSVRGAKESLGVVSTLLIIGMVSAA